jgi:hypothetical protein
VARHLTRSEPREDYVDAEVAKLRKLAPELSTYSDDELECLWKWFSVTEMCAGWHSVPDSRGGLVEYFLSLLNNIPEEAWEYL